MLNDPLVEITFFRSMFVAMVKRLSIFFRYGRYMQYLWKRWLTLCNYVLNSITTSRSSASPSSSSPGYSSRGPLSPYCAKIPELRSLTSKALGKSRSFWLACSGNTIPELMGNPIPELTGNPIPELTGYPIPELTGNPGRIPRDPIPHSQLGISLLNPESRPVQLLWKKRQIK